jgi:pseudouridylate synthase
MHAYIEYSHEVLAAQKNNQPLLALETTVLTHGLPYPQNLETVLAMEHIARAQHVVPASIALMRGKIKIGLTAQELEQLASDKTAIKASRRDIAYALSQQKNAGTTVAATLFCAHLAGISVFATGGIGGVHRGDALDVSADLYELARTPMALVCAGAKAILDIAKTVELLETLSIPVIGYRTDTFPAFYTRSTTYPISLVAQHMDELIALIRAQQWLNLSEGTLIANPIPPADEIPANVIEPVIQEALVAARRQGISGKAVTPFLLHAVVEATHGESLKANTALLKNNVTVGAQIAFALHR